MKALCATGYGKNIEDRLEFRNVSLPYLGADQVHVKIHAAALNPADYKIIYGQARLAKRLSKPWVVGFDLSGEIIAVGEKVSDFRVGDKVYSKVPWEQIGTLCEEAIVDANMVAFMPTNLSFEEAASIPLAACTALDVFNIGGLNSGDKVLIQAGSGGVGSLAIQLAKHIGAYVITTTSSKNVDWVRQLGADEVIDYTKQDLEKVVSEVDFVFDTLGNEHTIRSVKLLKNGGTLMCILGHFDDQTLKELKISKILRNLSALRERKLFRAIKEKNIFYRHIFSYPSKEKLDHLTSLIESEQIRPVVDRIYSFDQAIEALKYLETERAKGKVVIRIIG